MANTITTGANITWLYYKWYERRTVKRFVLKWVRLFYSLMSLAQCSRQSYSSCYLFVSRSKLQFRFLEFMQHVHDITQSMKIKHAHHVTHKTWITQCICWNCLYLHMSILKPHAINNNYKTSLKSYIKQSSPINVQYIIYN